MNDGTVHGLKKDEIFACRRPATRLEAAMSLKELRVARLHALDSG